MVARDIPIRSTYRLRIKITDVKSRFKQTPGDTITVTVHLIIEAEFQLSLFFCTPSGATKPIECTVAVICNLAWREWIASSLSLLAMTTRDAV